MFFRLKSTNTHTLTHDRNSNLYIYNINTIQIQTYKMHQKHSLFRPCSRSNGSHITFERSRKEK